MPTRRNGPVSSNVGPQNMHTLFAPVLTPEISIQVTKLEAAERQLDESILLHFERRDAVSIHTLASAAYQVISDICKHKGIKREIEDSQILDEMGIKGELLASIRRPQNFFKHADNDPTGKVQLKPLLTMCFIMASVQYLLQLRSRQSPECDVFRTWFFLRFPSYTPSQISAIANARSVPIDPSDYQFFRQTIERRRSDRGGAAA